MRRPPTSTETAIAPITPTQTVGPFFALGLCERPAATLVPPGSSLAVLVAGHVLDGAGEGVPDALVETWQASPEGSYLATPEWFGRCGTGPTGEFAFVTSKPGRVPGAGGGLQAPHLEVLVFARGLLRPVLTRMYFPEEAESNAADPVLASVDPERRETLVALPDGSCGLRFDVRLQGERETVFLAV